MEKYDIHTHILPDIDDGSADIDISLILLEELEEQGVTHVAFTPHFYSQNFDMKIGVSMMGETIEQYLDRRLHCFKMVSNAYEGDMRFTYGCEVYMSENLLEADDLSFFCYRNTNFMLVEMPYDSNFPPEQIEWLNALIHHYRIVPILAHIERYPILIKNPYMLETLVNMGCMAQVNTEGLYTRFLGKKLIKLINMGFVHFIGSDTHSTIRGCDYGRGYRILDKNCPPEVISRIIQNGRMLFMQRGDNRNG